MASFIQKLPLELLERVFVEATRPYRPSISNTSAPATVNAIQLCGVCKQWRQVVLHDKMFWTDLELVLNKETIDRGYPDPKAWVRYSQGAPLQIRLQEYHFFERGDQENDCLDSPEYTHDQLAEAIKPLVQFLVPLLPQVESLSIFLHWPKDFVLASLVDLWISHGTLGRAKSLEIQSCPRTTPSRFRVTNSRSPATEQLRRPLQFFESLNLLHLENVTMPDWSNLSYSNITSLYISSKLDPWTLDLFQLRSIIAPCANLKHLTLDSLDMGYEPPNLPHVALHELKTLTIGSVTSLAFLESLLGMVSVGQMPLSLSLYIPHWSQNAKTRALSAMMRFLCRSNVTELHVRSVEYFCSAFEIGPLPRVRRLLLHRILVTEEHHHSPLEEQMLAPLGASRSIQPMRPLWPALETLHISNGRLAMDHICTLLSIHPIRTLYLKDCTEEVCPAGYPQTIQPISEDGARILAAKVSRLVFYKAGWVSWPSA